MTATAELAVLHGDEHGHDTGGEGGAFARELGAWLRLHRELRGLSLTDVERLSDGRFNRQTLQSYEAGTRAVPAETLTTLARFYSVPVTQLLPDCGPGRRRVPALSEMQLGLLAVLDGDAPRGWFTYDELAALLPSRNAEGISKTARSLERLGLADGAGVDRVRITEAGRKVVAANGTSR
jgi:transcriptional regulator with XRE-family HTH domain